MQIFYTNDMHNRLKALDWLEARLPHWTDGEPPLLLDGGDAIGGSNTAFRLDEPALQRMRKLGFRAMAMGNREFHYFRWVQRWRECERGFPILAANLHDLRSAHQPWRPHLVIDRPAASDGLKKVALIGLTPVQFPHRHFWEKVTGFRFDPPKDTLAVFCRHGWAGLVFSDPTDGRNSCFLYERGFGTHLVSGCGRPAVLGQLQSDVAS